MNMLPASVLASKTILPTATTFTAPRIVGRTLRFGNEEEKESGRKDEGGKKLE